MENIFRSDFLSNSRNSNYSFPYGSKFDKVVDHFKLHLQLLVWLKKVFVGLTQSGVVDNEIVGQTDVGLLVKISLFSTFLRWEVVFLAFLEVVFVIHLRTNGKLLFKFLWNTRAKLIYIVYTLYHPTFKELLLFGKNIKLMRKQILGRLGIELAPHCLSVDRITCTTDLCSYVCMYWIFLV